MKSRPGRRSIRPWVIAEQWRERLTSSRMIGLGEPYCFRCWWMVPRVLLRGEDVPSLWNAAGSLLDKCHLIDRAEGGLDVPANMVMMCRVCHRAQPAFFPGEEDLAIDWVFGGTYRRPFEFQLVTESFPLTSGEEYRLVWVRFSEILAAERLASV